MGHKTRAQHELDSIEAGEARRAFADLVDRLDPDHLGRKEIYCLTTRTNSNGTFRRVRVFVSIDGQIIEQTSRVARIIGQRWHPDGIGMSGGGTNFHHHIVSEVNRLLYGHSEVITFRSL